MSVPNIHGPGNPVNFVVPQWIQEATLALPPEKRQEAKRELHRFVETIIASAQSALKKELMITMNNLGVQ